MDLTKPPRTPDLPAYKLPPLLETTLPNGLELVVVEDQRFPLVTARMGFYAGSKFDPADLPGLAESTGALLTEGTERRTARQIAEEVASIGGSLRGDASPDALLLGGCCLAENLPRYLDLMADVARNATFPPDEVQLRKQNRMQELLAQRSEAAFLADEKFTELVFHPHPYARQDPTPESVARLSREALLGYRDRHVAPNNAVLVLLGAIPPRERVLDLIAAAFGDWQRRETPPPPPPNFAEPRQQIVLVERPGSVQADIRIGRLAVNRLDPDYFPLLVGNTILGGGTSSRMFMNIREQMGYAYDVRTMVQPLRDAGVFATVTQVRSEVIEHAMDALYNELRKIGDEAVTPDEIATAKNYLSGVFVIRLETQDGLAAQLAGLKLLGLPLEYLEKYTGRIRAVEPGQLRAAARKYIEPGRAAIVVVGDAAAIQKKLEKFGDVTVVTEPEA